MSVGEVDENEILYFRSKCAYINALGQEKVYFNVHLQRNSNIQLAPQVAISELLMIKSPNTRTIVYL